jgi:hypothetical protein
MAIKKTIEKTAQGFQGKLFLENAYCKISKVEWSKQDTAVTVLIQESNSAAVLESRHFVFTPNLDNGNIIAQAYNHLKTLPEFAGATDC